MSYCADAAPIWAAFQDGDGEWTRVFPTVKGDRVTFRRELASNRAAIATLTSFATAPFTLLSVLYGAPADLPAAGDTTRVDCPGAETKTLRGSVAGLAPNDFALINLESGSGAVVNWSSGTSFSLAGVTTGPHDLFAARAMSSGNATTGMQLILRRNVDLPDGATIPVLDFSAGETFVPVTRNVTFVGADSPIQFSLFLTANGQITLPLIEQPATATQPYFAIPEGKLQPRDLQELHASTTNGSFGTVDTYYRVPIDRTIRFGAPLIAPAFTIIGTSSAPRIRARFVPQADYDQATTVMYLETSTQTFLTVTMTPRYGTIESGYQLDIPDLAGVSGFNPAWTLRPGPGVIWTAIGVGGTLPFGKNSIPFDGAVRRTAQYQNSLTLP